MDQMHYNLPLMLVQQEEIEMKNNQQMLQQKVYLIKKCKSIVSLAVKNDAVKPRVVKNKDVV